MFSMISLYESCIFPLDKPIIYPMLFRKVRDSGPLELVAQFPAGSGRNRFRRLTRAMGISTSSLAVFHRLPPTASAAAAAVLMEGWELTPRGLPVLLSLFMSDDIATLLAAFANPKAPQCSLSSLSGVRGQTSVSRAGVNTSCEMRSASVILLLPVPRLPHRDETGLPRLSACQIKLRYDTLNINTPFLTVSITASWLKIEHKSKALLYCKDIMYDEIIFLFFMNRIIYHPDSL